MTPSEAAINPHTAGVPPAIRYRPDIDGMRAMAVIAVVLFHNFPAVCPGGFIGVDIFFVISGYLISKVILTDLSRGEFSFATFYARRIRRIFPALGLVLAFTLVVGWYILTPLEWHRLAKNVLGGAGFVANFLHPPGESYFDNPVGTAPLMHLWSLGIEEQFYLVWPLVLFAFWRFSGNGQRRRLVMAGILLIFGSSFLYNILAVRIDREAAFFSPLTRTWELLAGAALARAAMVYGEIRSRATSGFLSAFGVLLVVAGLTLMDEGRRLPGWWALLPVAGTVSLIWAGPAAWLHRHVLSCSPLVGIGLISYPLYLWHWPLLVFFTIIQYSSFELGAWRYTAVKLVLAALALILSWATYRLVETPMRFSKTLAPAFRVKLLLAGMAFAAVLGALSLELIEPRLHSPAVRELERAKTDIIWAGNWKRSGFSTYEVASADPTHATLMVGDSHMMQYIPRAHVAIGANPQLATAVFATMGQCAPLPGVNHVEPGHSCPAFYDYWNELAWQDRFSTIAISCFWASHDVEWPQTFQGHPATEADLDEAWARLASDLRALRSTGKRVVVLEDNAVSHTFDPAWGYDRLNLVGFTRLAGVPRDVVESGQEPVSRRLRELQRQSSVEIVPIRDYWCNNAECPALDSDGTPLYVDRSHLRRSKVARIATYIDDLLKH